MKQGNLSNTKRSGSRAPKCWIDFGLGDQASFGKRGDVLIMLLRGGTKKGQ